MSNTRKELNYLVEYLNPHKIKTKINEKTGRSQIYWFILCKQNESEVQ